MARSRRSAGAGPQPSAADGRITVPHLNRDPLQSLRPWPVVIEIAQHELEIPALPAADWLVVLMTDALELDDVFPGLLPEDDAELVEDLLMDGTLDVDDYQDLIFDVIETISARPWWVTLRLCEIARTSWDVLGPEMTRQVDPTRVSLSNWLDSLLIAILKNMEAKDAPMFTMRLEAPPVGSEAEAEEPIMSRDAFMAMAGP